MAVAADVPGKYDLVLNGQGYLFLDSIEPSLPFRTHRASYTYSPTFIDRQNVQGNYGDDSQDFWLTATQNNWAGGEGQRFLRTNDEESVTSYWQGTNVDVRKTGEVTLRKTITGLTFAAAIKSVAGVGGSQHGAVSTTNLYTVNNAGTITDLGAHGLGAAPSQYGLLGANGSWYMSTTSAGTVGIRRWFPTPVFSTFSATGADALAFLNNTLYGLTAAGVLNRYSTAGVASAVFTWQDPTGSGMSIGTASRILPYGGKLAIMLNFSNQAEVWIYDGNGVSRIWELPKNLYPYDMTIANGVIFVSGLQTLRSDVGSQAIYYYVNGQTGQLWTSDVAGGTSGPAMAPWDNGIVFTDDSRGAYYQYDSANGSFSTLGTFTQSISGQVLAASNTQFLHIHNATDAYYHPVSGAATATSGTITTSLIDFDSSLDKLFRGIKVDFTPASDGNFGSVDIAYRVGDLTGSYTNLQTGAVSGTEYPLTGVSGRNLSIKVTINKGTSTSGPTLKRIYARAVPILQQFRRREYVLDMTGTTKVPQQLRDGTNHPKSGREQANDLVTASQATAPFSVTDRFGTFNGLIDLNDPQGFGLFEMHPSTDEPTKSGAFIGQVLVREV